MLARGGEGVVLRKPKSHYFDPHVFFKKEPFVDEEVMVWKNQTDGKLNCLRYTIKLLVNTAAKYSI